MGGVKDQIISLLKPRIIVNQNVLKLSGDVERNEVNQNVKATWGEHNLKNKKSF